MTGGAFCKVESGGGYLLARFPSPQTRDSYVVATGGPTWAARVSEAPSGGEWRPAGDCEGLPRDLPLGGLVGAGAALLCDAAGRAFYIPG